MSGPGAMHDEMPGYFPGRPGGGEHDEPLLDMILDRRPLPPGAPPEMHVLARTLAAAAGSADPRDLAGEAAALAAFRRSASPAGVSHAAQRPARRWLPRRSGRGRLPIAAALVGAAAGLGSITAAYVGVLPGPIQQMAHVTVGAPSASHNRSPQTRTATRPPGRAPYEPGPSDHKQARSAGSTPAPSQANHQQQHHGSTGRSPEPAPTCKPGPVPTRTPPKPGPTQYPTLGPGQPVVTPQPSPTASCPVIVPQAGGSRSSH